MQRIACSERDDWQATNGAMRTQMGFLDLTSAVQDNPLAAALIGGGALWLLMGNDKLKGGRVRRRPRLLRWSISVRAIRD